MGFKYGALQSLEKRGFNTFDYLQCKPTDISIIEQYYKANKMFTIRSDTDVLQFNLPMYIVRDNSDLKSTEFNSFITECKERNLQLILSNGLKFDEIQLANVVVNIDKEIIHIEVSEDKIPLRKMYEYPNNITSMTGQIHQCVRHFIRRGKILKNISNNELEGILNYIFRYRGNSETYFEITYYPKAVGKQKTNLIFWQVH